MATVKVKEDGKAPSGLSVGTNVVTGGGTYQITGVKEDGSYESKKVSDVNTSNYKGNYDSPGGGSGSTSSGYSGGGSSGGGGGGSSRNTSPTVRNAVNTINTATGVTNGYKPIGSYNDAELRAMGHGAVDPITQYKMQYEEAKAAGDQAGMDAAHAAAEAYRSRYGYSGGSDGSQRIAAEEEKPIHEEMPILAYRQRQGLPSKTGALPAQQELTARQVPAWQMPEYNYTPFEQTEAGKAAKAEYDALLKRMESYQPFSYNPETDPLYQQYADSYTRSGQRAMSDILGQLAARTGGMASSYAGTMAQQQYDQYMQELANKVPELRQLAYNMYVDNYNRDLGQYDRTYQRYADDYSRYIDQNRFNYDIFADAAKMDYQANRDAVADSQWAREMALRELQNQQNYGLDLTKLNYDMYSDQRNYDRDVYTNNRNYNRDVLTSDRAYEADRADTKWNQDWTKTQFDYQKEQDARQWELTQRQYADQQKAELRERVDRYGYMPTQQDAEAYGLSAAELLSLQEQARHVRAADASKYYSGW